MSSRNLSQQIFNKSSNGRWEVVFGSNFTAQSAKIFLAELYYKKRLHQQASVILVSVSRLDDRGCDEDQSD